MNDVRNQTLWGRQARLACVLAAAALLTGGVWAQGNGNATNKLSSEFADPGARPPNGGPQGDSSFIKDKNGEKYAKAIVLLRQPSDSASVRNWVINGDSKNGKLAPPQKGSVYYLYQSWPAMAVMVPLKRIPELANVTGVARVIPNRLAHRSQLKYESLGRTTGRLEAGTVNTGLTGNGIGIAILDSGIDHRHAALPDFSNTAAGRKVAGRVDIVGIRRSAVTGDGWETGQDYSTLLARLNLASTDFTAPTGLAPKNSTAQAANPDPYGHGTHVAATAAGSNVLPLNSAGLATRAKLYDVRVLDEFGKGELADVLAGIDAALAAGLAPIKINMVVKRGTNDHEIVPLARHVRDRYGPGVILRFIEYMDVGATNGWCMNEVLPSADVVQRLSQVFPLAPLQPNATGETAERWRFVDGGGEIGVISSVTQAFCRDCNRARLSTEGKLFLCLFATRGHDLRALLRSGAGDADITSALAAVWAGRDDRYSELRAAQPAAPAVGERRVEMHYIGG